MNRLETVAIMVATLVRAGLHRRGHRAVEVVGADGLDQPDRVQAVPQLLRRPCHVQLDVALAEPVEHLAQRDLSAGVEVADGRAVEHHVPHGLGRTVHGGPQPALEVVGVGEEQPVLDAVDDDTRADARVGLVRDVHVAVVTGGPAQHGVGGSCPPTHTTVMAAMTTSTLLLRVSSRHCTGSISLAAAYTMTAPSTAEGRYSIGAVRKSRMTTIVPAAASPLTWLVAPMSSLTAVRDPLVPTGMLWVTPAEIWATPKARSSWLASTTSWWRAAKERAVRMESEKATRNTARAATTSVPRSARDTSGSSSDGSPRGTGPVTETPWATRSRAQDAAMPRITTARAPGSRLLIRPATTSRANETRPTRTVAPLALPRWPTMSTVSGMAPSASLETPSSLPSWPRISTTATPVM